MLREAGPVQAQEPRAARLAFRARSRGLDAEDVDRARTEERSLLRGWMMRKTAHLIPTEDAGWMLPLFAGQIVPWSRRRLADLGFDGRAQQRALALIHRAVDREGPLTRPELVERLVAAGLPADTEAKYHLWTLATLDGELCLGPDRRGLSCLVRASEWIGEPRLRSREDSLAELSRRYLRGYAPATDRDLARWSGLPLRDARAGLDRIAAELEEVRVGAETMLRLAGAVRRAGRSPVIRILGAYDNYNLGYVSRGFAVGAEHEQRINPGGGIIRPIVTVDGRAVATWSSKRSGRRLAVDIAPFAALDDEWKAAIAAEVADLGRFEAAEAEVGWS